MTEAEMLRRHASKHDGGPQKTPADALYSYLALAILVGDDALKTGYIAFTKPMLGAA